VPSKKEWGQELGFYPGVWRGLLVFPKMKLLKITGEDIAKSLEGRKPAKEIGKRKASWRDYRKPVLR